MEEQQRIHQELRRKLADPTSDSSEVEEDDDGAAGAAGHSSDEGEQVGKKARNAKAVAQLRRLLDPGESWKAGIPGFAAVGAARERGVLVWEVGVLDRLELFNLGWCLSKVA